MHRWFILLGIVPSLPSNWTWQINHLTFYIPCPGLTVRSLVSPQVRFHSYWQKKVFAAVVNATFSGRCTHRLFDEESKANKSIFFQVHLMSLQRNWKGRPVLLVPSHVYSSLGFLLFSSELPCLHCKIIMSSALHLSSQSWFQDTRFKDLGKRA